MGLEPYSYGARRHSPARLVPGRLEAPAGIQFYSLIAAAALEDGQPSLDDDANYAVVRANVYVKRALVDLPSASGVFGLDDAADAKVYGPENPARALTISLESYLGKLREWAATAAEHTMTRTMGSAADGISRLFDVALGLPDDPRAAVAVG